MKPHDHELSAERQVLYDMLQQVDAVQRRGSTDVEKDLLSINETAVTFVPGAKYVGITVVDGDGEIGTLAATDRFARVLDDVQRDAHEGPCLSAAWNQHTIVIDDMEAEARWPRYREQAVGRTPVRSVMSFRLYEQDKRTAALNFYAETAGVFDDESVELGLVMAGHLTVAWNVLLREQQFQSALNSRDVIGQAKGMLMERFDVDAVTAFELLRRLSQDSNTRIFDIAHRLVNTERT